MSVVLPGQHSTSDDNLSSIVISPESRSTSTLHAPLYETFHDSSFLHDSALDDSSSDAPFFPHDLVFGGPISSLKDENIFRVGFCNIGGFPAMFAPNSKAQEIKHFMALHDIDLFGGCEANINWSRSSEAMRLQEWFRDIPSCRTYFAHNVNKKAGIKQFGGTFWIGTGLASQFIVGMERDPSGLGRWVVCSLCPVAPVINFI